jgi:hypothetical protein
MRWLTLTRPGRYLERIEVVERRPARVNSASQPFAPLRSRCGGGGAFCSRLRDCVSRRAGLRGASLGQRPRCRLGSAASADLAAREERSGSGIADPDPGFALCLPALLVPCSQPRHIPAAVRRAVFERDGGRCTHVDERGVRCRETSFLDLHHLKPFGKQGRSSTSNLTLRCSAHNALAAEQDFGAEHIVAKRDSPPQLAQTRVSGICSPHGRRVARTWVQRWSCRRATVVVGPSQWRRCCRHERNAIEPTELEPSCANCCLDWWRNRREKRRTWLA